MKWKLSIISIFLLLAIISFANPVSADESTAPCCQEVGGGFSYLEIIIMIVILVTILAMIYLFFRKQSSDD
jgi:hypothetical protein